MPREERVKEASNIVIRGVHTTRRRQGNGASSWEPKMGHDVVVYTSERVAQTTGREERHTHTRCRLLTEEGEGRS